MYPLQVEKLDVENEADRLSFEVSGTMQTFGDHNKDSENSSSPQQQP
jgi:hypothetical protein